MTFNRRLTYRENGRWWYASDDDDQRRPIGWQLWLHIFRPLDRLQVGPDTGHNHW